MDVETMSERFVGIDVSKVAGRCACQAGWHCVPLRHRPGRSGRIGRAIAAAVALLVVLEASGGYEGVVAAALAAAGLPVAIVNPRQVRKFAGAIGRLAKTDAIDAAVIAHFAEAVRPAARPLPDDLALPAALN